MGQYVAAYSIRERRLVLMYVTYSDLFTFVTMLVAVITLVLTINKHNKK